MTGKAKTVRRQIFVLTAEEKKMAACVLAALLLGFATKSYRDSHPRPAVPLTARQQFEAKKTAKAAAARARSARGRRAKTERTAPVSATPTPPLEEDEDEAGIAQDSASSN